MAPLAVVFLILACLGWGNLALMATRTEPDDRWQWALVLGFGILGWLLFLPPLLGRVTAPAIILVALPGLAGLRRALLPRPRFIRSPDIPAMALVALAVAVLAVQIMVGLAPPSDADSLAYHFAIPRRMVLESHLVFVPRAADGAVPLLQQIHGMAALVLGGEAALTLWAALSGLICAPLLHSQARRWLSGPAALALTLVVVTTPAFLYGSGAGQVETRLAAFILAAVMAMGQSRQERPAGWVAIAGLAAGFAMGSKYTGLLIVLACGLVILIRHRSIRLAALFGAVALVAGGQWYGWNWWNTGDPVFPMLFGLIPYDPSVPWNAQQAAAFKDWSRLVELPLARSLEIMATYPWIASFTPMDSLENGRTGLGIFPILALPFAFWGAARSGRRVLSHPLADGVVVTALFYVLWFWFGASQRVRHYLPLLPFVLLALTVAAQSVAPRLRGLPMIALCAVLAVQAGGMALFSRNFAQRLIHGESREQYLARTVSYFPMVNWLNDRLGPDARLLILLRQWTYLLNHPSILAHSGQQAQIEVRDDSVDGQRYWCQLRRAGITHIALPVAGDLSSSHGTGGVLGLTRQIIEAGCASAERIDDAGSPIVSRTLGSAGGSPQAGEGVVVTLSPRTCPLEPACPSKSR